ncbi:MAG TPA: sulfotransferase [Sphingomicrobium sp.]|nr:sulfotransferase [Sphingomicrobium sp.]
MDQQVAALLERAAALRRAGRVDEAIGAYRELLEREPDLPDSWYNLGYLQRQARQYEAALDSYGQALDRGVRDPEEVHLNRAVILSDHLACPGEAETELKAALKLNPNYLPALLNLGNLHEDLGDRDAAQDAYRRALAAAPADALALSRLAGVLNPGSAAAEELIGQIQRELSSGRSAGERADIGFALGRLLDGRGDHDAAFTVYEVANKASGERFGPHFSGYGPAEQEQLVDRLIAAFAEPVADDSHRDAPIFICGMFRSGSTLVEQILAGHSKVAAAGELDLIPELVRRIPGYPEAVSAADEETLRSWLDFYRDGLAPFARQGCSVTDKRPDNFLHIGLIKTLFPAARIVHTHRNRLDNLLSLYFLHLGPHMPYALDLRDAAHWYDEQERLMAHWKRLYPNDIFDVDYDALVRDPRSVIESLLAFLGLEWEDSVLNFHERKGAVKTASVWQVREPLHARSSGRWRNYRDQLQSALGEAVGESVTRPKP